VLKLEQSHFTHALWLKKEFKTDSSVCGYNVYQKIFDADNWSTAGYHIRGKREWMVLIFKGSSPSQDGNFSKVKLLQLAKIHENCERLPL